MTVVQWGVRGLITGDAISQPSRAAAERAAAEWPGCYEVVCRGPWTTPDALPAVARCECGHAPHAGHCGEECTCTAYLAYHRAGVTV